MEAANIGPREADVAPAPDPTGAGRLAGRPPTRVRSAWPRSPARPSC